MATIYHEALHAYIRVLQVQLGSDFSTLYPGITVYPSTDANGNPISETVIDGHSVMAGNFLNPLQSAIQSLNSNFTPSYAMAQYGVINDPSINAINLAERQGSTTALGTKCK